MARFKPPPQGLSTDCRTVSRVLQLCCRRIQPRHVLGRLVTSAMAMIWMLGASASAAEAEFGDPFSQCRAAGGDLSAKRSPL